MKSALLRRTTRQIALFVALALCAGAVLSPAALAGERMFAGAPGVSDPTRAPGAADPPGSPGNLVGSAAGSTVSLSWDAPTTGGAPSAYTIEAGSAPGFANLADFSTGNSATRFSTSGVLPGLYFIRVRATNSAGASNPSNEIQLAIGPPGPPSGLVASSTGSSITLLWIAPATGGAPSAYIVEAGSASGLLNLASVSTGSVATHLLHDQRAERPLLPSCAGDQRLRHQRTVQRSGAVRRTGVRQSAERSRQSSPDEHRPGPSHARVGSAERRTGQRADELPGRGRFREWAGQSRDDRHRKHRHNVFRDGALAWRVLHSGSSKELVRHECHVE